MLRYDKLQIAEMIDTFIWSYHVGDNICYNIKVLFVLYENQQESAKPSLYNKPLIIQIVSIIEVLMYDLVTRLDGATAHYPSRIPQPRREEIKARLDREKQKHDYDVLGETMTVQRVKNYSMDSLVKLFQEFKLFGDNDDIYQRFQTAVRLRNRVHIFNWYHNFNSDEARTYSSAKAAEVERLLEGTLIIMSRLYPRPRPARQVSNWLKLMSA